MRPAEEAGDRTIRTDTVDDADLPDDVLDTTDRDTAVPSLSETVGRS
jgi:hypothetical protein